MNTRDELVELCSNLQECTENTTSSIMRKWADMNRLEMENAELKEEIQHLKDTACEIMSEEEPVIEPCPICGGEMRMKPFVDGVCICETIGCPYYIINTIEAHNAIARVLKEADSWTRGYMSTPYERLRDAMHDLRAIQAKVKGK